jgi:hypothetical protein
MQVVLFYQMAMGFMKYEGFALTRAQGMHSLKLLG